MIDIDTTKIAPIDFDRTVYIIHEDLFKLGLYQTDPNVNFEICGNMDRLVRPFMDFICGYNTALLFYDYPYQQIYEENQSQQNLSNYPTVNNAQALIIEKAINEEDYIDSLKYLYYLYSNQNDKANSIKRSMIEKYSARINPTGHSQSQPIQTPVQIPNIVRTADGRSVPIPPDQMEMIRNYIFDLAQQNGYVDRGRMSFSNVPDPDDYQPASQEPIFQNSPQFQQSQSVYQAPMTNGVLYQPIYTTRQQTNPEPQPEAAPVQEPEQASQQTRRAVYRDPITGMILYEPIIAQEPPPQQPLKPPKIIIK